jgi:hypothetical protein
MINDWRPQVERIERYHEKRLLSHMRAGTGSMRKDRGTCTGGEVEIIWKDCGLGNDKKRKGRKNEKRLGNQTGEREEQWEKIGKSHGWRGRSHGKDRGIKRGSKRGKR